jgi:hypothetical protein
MEGSMLVLGEADSSGCGVLMATSGGPEKMAIDVLFVNKQLHEHSCKPSVEADC